MLINILVDMCKTPTYHIIKRNNDEIVFIKSFIKLGLLPREGETIYFDILGPYYIVKSISHQVDKKHVVWITVDIL